MKRRILSLVLCFCMALSLLPMGALAAPSYTIRANDPNELFTALEQSEATITLDTDIDLSQTTSAALVVKSGKTITLDLNGHKIYNVPYAASSSTIQDAAITVSGTLILKDGAGGGAITGNTTKYGGVWINNGTLNLEGGSITGNTAKSYGGDVFVKGTFNVIGNATVGTAYFNPEYKIAFDQAGSLSGQTKVITAESVEYPFVITSGFTGDDAAAVFANGKGDGAEVTLNADGQAVLALSYQLTYDKNTEDEVTNLPGPVTAYSGMKMPDVDPVPSRVGYTFAGFNGKAGGETDGGYTFYGADGIGKLRPADRKGDVTLYAQWEPIKYTPRFNDGTGDVWGERAVTADEYTSKTAPAVTGKTFLGWSNLAEPTAEDILIPAGGKINGMDMLDYIKQDATDEKNYLDLYPVYSTNVYTMTYDLAGGVLPDGQTNPTTRTTTEDSNDITLVNPVREGYTFQGWTWGTKTDPIKTVKISKNDTTEKFEFVAHWKINTYRLTRIVDGDVVSAIDYEFGQSITTPPEPTKSGHTFSGWDPEIPATMPAKNLTVNATWDAKNYTITYELDGGTNDPANPATYSALTTPIKLADPSKDGYTFKGWYRGNTASSNIVTGQTGDLTFTAKWEPIGYKVYWNSNYPEAAGMDAQRTGPGNRTFDDLNWKFNTLSASNITPCPGYELVAWNTVADGSGVSYAPGADGVNLTTVSGAEIELYAQWELKEYTITYELNGGTNAEANPTKISSQNVSESAPLVLQDATKEGYTFTGWTCDTVTQPTKGISLSKADRDWTFTANWKPIEYQIQWIANNGTEQKSAVGTRDYDKTWAILAPDDTNLKFAYAGHTFQNWLGSDGKTYEAGQEVQGLLKDTETVLTFTAQWKAEEYTITYDLDGGALPDGKTNPATYTVADSFKLVNPEKDGYTFTGWTNDRSLTTPTKDITIDKGTKGNIKFVAHWAETEWTMTSPYTPAATITGNTATFSDTTLKWYEKDASVGRSVDGWWVGVLFTAPEAVTADNITNTTYSNNGGQKWKSFDSAKDSGNTYPAYMQAWVLVTPEYIENALENDSVIQYTYKFAWDGDADNAETFTIKIDPTNITLTGMGDNSETDKDPQIVVKDGVVVDKNEYFDVTFDSDNGGTATTQSVRFNQTATKPADPVKTGYDFLGWFAEGKEEAYDFDTPVKANVALKAQWEKQTFTVNFFDTDGTTSLSDPQTVEYGASATQPANPEKVGYTFDKWMTKATESVASAAYDFAAAVTSNLDLVASWTGNTVKYTFANVADSNIATKITDYNSETNSVSFVVGNKEAFKLPADLTKTGYDFQGWTWAEQTEPKKEVTIPKDDPYNYDFTANWQAKTYEVALNSQFADLTPDPAKITVTYDAAYGELPTLTKDGFEFKGWYSDPNAENDNYKIDADTVVVEPVPKTLYAHWEGQTVNYTYAGIEGATFEGGTNPTERTVGTEGFTLANPAKAGYTFLGWTWTGHDQKETTVRIEANDPYNYDFVANWEIIPAVAPAITLTTNPTDGKAIYGNAITVSAALADKTDDAGTVIVDANEYKVVDYTWTVKDAEGNAVGTAEAVQSADGTIGNYTLPGTTPVGTYTVFVTAKVQRTDNDQTAVAASAIATLEVTPKSVEGMIQLIDEQAFANKQITPAIVVKDGDTTLVEGTDYTVTYGENVNAGETAGSVTITGIGNYGQTDTETFTITPKDISSEGVQATLNPTSYTYDGEAKKPVATVIDNVLGVILKAGTDFQVTYEDNTAVSTTEKMAKAIITGIGNYAGTKDIPFEITKAKMNVTATGYEGIYDGVGHGITVTGYPEGAVVTYSDKLNGTYSETLEYKNIGEYDVYYKVQADNYEDASGVATVKITPRVAVLKWGDTNFTYDPAATQAPACEITNIAPDAAGAPKDDVKIVVEGGQVNAGTYTATATLSGEKADNYKLPENNTINFTIAAAIPDVTVTANTLTYNGQPQELVTTKLTDEETGKPVDSLPAGCWIEYSRDGSTGWTRDIPTETNAGTYQVYYRIFDHNNYQNVLDNDPVSVTIAKAPLQIIPNETVITYGDAPTNNGVTYNGFVNNEDESVLDGKLVYTDYNYVQFGDVNNGKYHFKASGLTSNNYEITYDFGRLTVKKLEAELSWDPTVFTYNGAEQCPKATVSNAVNGDVLTVTVTGGQTIVGENYTANATTLSGEKADNYTMPEEAKTTFKIIPLDISTSKDIVITLSDEVQTYSNGPKTPAVTVKLGESTLAKDTDYTVQYANNVNAGTDTAKAIITGQGNFTGSVEKTFTIQPRDIASPLVKVSLADPAAEIVYDGQEKKPELKIHDDYTGLDLVLTAEDQTGDYTVTYSDNINATKADAKAKVTITGVNNYFNSRTFEFEIAKADPVVTLTLAEGLTYTGKDQDLLTAASTTGGTLYLKAAIGQGTSGNGFTTKIPTGKNAGDYYIFYKVEGNNNYNSLMEDYGFVKYMVDGKQVPVTIAKADPNNVAITVAGKTYDGEPITAATATADFAAENEPVITYYPATKDESGTYTVAEGAEALSAAPTNAGTYVVKADVLGTNNYVAGSAQEGFEIAKAPVTIKWTDAAPLTYDGSDKTPTTGIVGIKEADKEAVDAAVNLTAGPVTTTGEEGAAKTEAINAGTYTATATLTGNAAGNYVIAPPTEEGGASTATHDFTIAKAPLSIKADDKSKTEGNADPALTYQITSGKLVDGDSITGALARQVGETVGKYAIEQGQLTAGDNYDITYQSGTFTINAKSSGGGGGGGSSSGGGGGGGSTANFTVTVNSTPNGGTATANPTKAASGKEITVTAKPAATYKVDSVTATYGTRNTEVKVTEGNNGTYTFTMPNGNVTVTANFVKDPSADPNNDPSKGQDTIRNYSKDFEKCDDTHFDNCPMNPYSDADPQDWYHDGVHFCIENKIMQGYDDGHFYPEKDTTRAQLVQVLYNIVGQPKVSSDKSYSDVKAGAWYYNAIQWATKNDIVSGYNDGKFRPDDPITREQVARVLMGFAQFLGYDTSATSTLKDYNDTNTVSNWATPYVQWAVGAGVYCGPEGEPNLLGANGYTVRSELATMMMNFCTKLAK